MTGARAMTAAEERSFGAAVYRLHPELMRYARSLIGNKSGDAEDLASETMTRAWKARNRFEPGTNMRAWLFSILRNLFLSERRRDRWRGGYVDDLAIDMLPIAAASQEDRMHLADALRALEVLPAKQREAVEALALGASYEEVEAVTGAPSGTVKSRICRGRAALVEVIDKGLLPPRPAPAPKPTPKIIVVPVEVWGVGGALKIEKPPRKRRGRPIKIPPSKPGTELHHLCVLVAAYGGRGAASKLSVDKRAVFIALRGEPMPPRLRKALAAHTEALAA